MTDPITEDKSTQDKLRDGYDHARHAAADALDRTRDKASDALASSKDAARKAAAGLDANPLAILAGGIAVGAIAGALIPRSARERDLLRPVGRKIGETARSAVKAAREAGYAELDQRGLTKGAAKDQVKGLFDGLTKAAGSAGAAAVSAAKKTDAKNDGLDAA